jgi:hypothetical protein
MLLSGATRAPDIMDRLDDFFLGHRRLPQPKSDAIDRRKKYAATRSRASADFGIKPP